MLIMCEPNFGILTNQTTQQIVTIFLQFILIFNIFSNKKKI